MGHYPPRDTPAQALRLCCRCLWQVPAETTVRLSGRTYCATCQPIIDTDPTPDKPTS